VRRIIPALAVLAVAAWILTAFFAVRVSDYAIVLRFGRPVRVISTPGLKVKLPAPIDRVARFDRRLLVFDVPAPGEPPRELLTQDKKNIEVSSYTCWQVEDPLRFLQTVANREGAEAYLRDIIISEMGKQLGRHDLSALISVQPEDLKTGEIAGEILSAAGEAARRECGVRIVDFRIKRINLPEQNRESVFERMRAERKQIATRYRSEGKRQATTLRAEADRERLQILSEAVRESLEIHGKAEAEAARIYNQAYGKSPEFYAFLRTLSSYEKTMTDKTTILLPPGMEYLKLLAEPGLSAAPEGDETAPLAGDRPEHSPGGSPAQPPAAGEVHEGTSHGTRTRR